MIISISNPVQATQIFLVIFLITILFSFRKKTNNDFFSNILTQELKGLAILSIVFAHIGYYLVNDNRFLFPLTIAAGVGVNMFLFLSGFGLASSSLVKQYSIIQFYWRRIPKLYLPFWLSCLVFLLLDFFILNRFYGAGYVGQTLLGFFPRADIWLDLNSPLWYFSFIVFYYLLFPLVFWRRYVWLSSSVLYLAGYLLMKSDPVIIGQVMRLYQVHIMAFPLGVFFAGLVNCFNKRDWKNVCLDYATKYHLNKYLKRLGYWAMMTLLIWGIGNTAYFSHVGGERWLEEFVSLVTMSLVLVVFFIKKIESRFLILFGTYSYEIYLIHWPILSRFDISFRFLPAWLATVTYLLFFIAAGWGLQITAKLVANFRNK